MGTISDKLSYLNETKTSIKTAIKTKGVNISDNTPFREYADKISEINVVNSVGMNYEKIEKINDNWYINNYTNSRTNYTYDSTQAQSELNNSTAFVPITLPHDWSIYLDYNANSLSTYEGGYLDGGDAWYKKDIYISSDNTNKRLFLYFEGIYMESDIVLNGTHLASHKHGYTPFYVEITDYVVFDSNNSLCIFVKNMQPSSRWYSGSGIYRDVYLITSNKLAIEQQGVVITTPNIEVEYPKGYTTVNTKVNIENINTTNKSIQLKTLIKYNNEVICTKKSENITVNANDNYLYEDNIIVSNPVLWSEFQGNIYICTTEIYSDGELVSYADTYFGFRWMKFDSDKGFFLNGKHIKLKGMCMHHDNGALGSEVNQSAIDRQLKILKEMGCNSVRLTHNPSSPQFLLACMKNGITCIEEVFDCWSTSKKPYDYGRYFNQHAKADLKSTIQRGINNPAIIMWSVGNEISRTSSSDDTNGNGIRDALEIATNLRNWVEEIDITRPVTIGENKKDNDNALEIAVALGTVGYNYASKYQLDIIHKKAPNSFVYCSEEASGLSTRGEYFHDNDQYYCASYDNEYVPWGCSNSSALEKFYKDYVGGIYVWTGFDYIGEPTPFNKFPTKSSYFGIVDLAGFKKDAFYLYQSCWTDVPMCHIVPMDWKRWTEGEDVNVMIYSNASKVNLFLNGSLLCTLTDKSLSTKYAFTTTVPFEKGRLIANAYNQDDILVAQDIVCTYNSPKSIKISSDKLYVSRENRDLIYITADMIDNNGNFCANANEMITFSVDNGEIVGIDNGFSACVERMRGTNSHSVFNGKCLCIIKPDGTSNDVSVSANFANGTSNIVKISQIDGCTVVSPIEKIPFIDATEQYVFVEDIIPCESLTTSSDNISLTNRDSYTIDYSVLPTNTTDTITWVSSNPQIATVNNGVVTPLNEGSTVITLSCGSKTCSVAISISGISVGCDSIVIDQSDITLTSTSQYDINATVTPDNCTYEVSWSSSDPDIVTVNGGHLTAIANGNAVVTALCGDKTAICNVTVNLDANTSYLDSISATKTKVSYVVNEEFTTDDISVLATYSDNVTKAITEFTVDSSAINTAIVGNYNIIISYTEDTITKTTTITIDVVELSSTDWDLEWNGEPTLPERIVLPPYMKIKEYDSNYVLYGETLSSIASITDSAYENAELEFEIMTSNLNSGSGWKFGISLCSAVGKRGVMYADSNSGIIKIAYSTGTKITSIAIQTNTWYKMKVVSLGETKQYYIDDVLVYTDLSSSDADTVASNVWSTHPDWMIRAIRYKKN